MTANDVFYIFYIFGGIVAIVFSVLIYNSKKK